VAKPVVAGVLGITVLGETLETKGPGAFVLVAVVAVVIIATAALARGEAASMAAGTGQDLKLPPSGEAPHERLPGADSGQGDACVAEDVPGHESIPREGVGSRLAGGVSPPVSEGS
jgi:hypothetical protein